MDPATADALADINRRFYREHAEAFGATRRAPWSGWERLLPPLRRRFRGLGLRVLDVGCGHGRFGRFLDSASVAARLDYLGVDGSEELLAEARRLGPDAARWQRVDLLSEARALPRERFDLVVLFGVLDGIPGREGRRRLLECCVDRLAAGGRLIFTLWRHADDDDARRVTWERYNARALRRIDPARLEAGDRLRAWGEGDAVVRYLNRIDDAEVAGWDRALGTAPEFAFRADGRGGDQNDYRVLRRC